MKKTIVAFCFFIAAFLSSYGQWYERQYNVSDINQLSKGQLELSVILAKNNLLTAGFVSGMGAIGWTLTSLANMSVIGTGICAGVFVGGAITGIVYMQRIGKIKSTIRRNYPASASLNISPALILNKYSGSYSSGISLTFEF